MACSGSPLPSVGPYWAHAHPSVGLVSGLHKPRADTSKEAQLETAPTELHAARPGIPMGLPWRARGNAGRVLSLASSALDGLSAY